MTITVQAPDVQLAATYRTFGPFDYAPLSQRVLAALIDGFVVNAVTAVLAIVVGIFVVMGITPQATGIAAMVIFRIALGIAYHVGMEGSTFQSTPGKRICNLHVARPDGAPLTYAQALTRYFAKILTACTFLIGYAMALFTERHQTLHDLLTDSFVVRDTPIAA